MSNKSETMKIKLLTSLSLIIISLSSYAEIEKPQPFINIQESINYARSVKGNPKFITQLISVEYHGLKIERYFYKNPDHRNFAKDKPLSFKEYNFTSRDGSLKTYQEIDYQLNCKTMEFRTTETVYKDNGRVLTTKIKDIEFQPKYHAYLIDVCKKLQ